MGVRIPLLASIPPVNRSSPTAALVPLAAVFYGVLAAAALLWNHLAGRAPIELIWDPVRASGVKLLLGVAAGLATGLLVVAISRLTVARYGWAQELYRWFAALLGPLGWRQAAALAALSAVGEELLFRGAMQPSLGLYVTSALFALAHLPPRRRLLPWTVGAAVLGLAFGAITMWTANLAGAVVAHFVINLLNLKHVSDFAGQKLPHAEATPSMGDNVPTDDDDGASRDTGSHRLPSSGRSGDAARDGAAGPDAG